MTYSGERRIIDADSHLIELDDFLTSFADPGERMLIPPMAAQRELPVSAEALARGRELFAKRQSDPETMAKFEAGLRDTRKSGWSRIGAFDPAERSHCLDLFGFEQQLVLPTYAYHQFAHDENPDVLRAGARALNRAMGTFCSHDPRLRAIGYLPLTLGPEEAGALMDQGLDDGCYTFMVETNEPKPDRRSFTHPDFDPIWARFADARAPFVAHIAVNGDYQAVPPSFANNGLRAPDAAGDAPAGALAMVTLHKSAELFLTSMIFDGVFARHPKLRGLSLEHGATWLPSWLKSLDTGFQLFQRMQPHLAEQPLPSQTVRERLRFAPFAGEPAGWIIEQIGPEILVFGSDYPHPEGTHDPIGRLEATMTECDQATFDAFYHGNMQTLMATG